jgi:peptidoglycan/LPS O-acetylase OafA/YrhL
LPGVFENNPFANAVNASLWTLRYEVLMYLALSLFGFFAGKRHFRLACLLFLFVFLVFWLFEFVFKINHDFLLFQILKKIIQPALIIFELIGLTFDGLEILNLGIFYFSGTLLHFYKDKINQNIWISVLFTLPLAWIKNPMWIMPFLWVIIPCFSLIFAKHAPYGVYIYAFPVQQIIAWYFLKNGLGWFFSLITAAISTYFLAFFSWKAIEQPALRMKSVYLNKLKSHYST